MGQPLGAAITLPTHKDHYYGGEWRSPKGGAYIVSRSPGTGKELGPAADGNADDAAAAVAAAKKGFEVWSRTPPLARAKAMREVATIIRRHADELALLDAADCGNPVREMGRDALNAAESFDFFAGLVTEMKGDSIPMGPNAVNFTVREPRGVVARIVAFNHPLMFIGAKAAAPLAAGNSVVMKPPEQAPLSALRLAELIGDVLPPGVFNVVTGGREVGSTLSTHPDIAMVTLIGSVPTGRAVMRSASDTLKPTLLELGGKNALIAFPDADPDEVARGMIAGMNFTWCGQSCGSTSRAFLHASIHDAVLERLKAHIGHLQPGDPVNPETTMGALISKEHFERVLGYIDIANGEGATLFHGGKVPEDPSLAGGYYVQPTVFTDVVQSMRIAQEEVFGPVLSVLRWVDEARMMEEVNSVPYGLTCSIWTRDLEAAHRTAQQAHVGYVWVNETGKHFLGAPFGGVKQSGNGREECLAELLSFTQEKNIHIKLR